MSEICSPAPQRGERDITRHRKFFVPDWFYDDGHAYGSVHKDRQDSLDKSLEARFRKLYVVEYCSR